MQMEEGLKFRLNTYSKSIKVSVFKISDIIALLGSWENRVYKGLTNDRGDFLSDSWYFVKLWELIKIKILFTLQFYLKQIKNKI